MISATLPPQLIVSVSTIGAGSVSSKQPGQKQLKKDKKSPIKYTNQPVSIIHQELILINLLFMLIKTDYYNQQQEKIIRQQAVGLDGLTVVWYNIAQIASVSLLTARRV